MWLGPGKVVLHLSFAVPALLLLDHLLVALQHNLFHLVKEDSLSVSGEHGIGNYSIQYGFLRAPRDLVEVAIDKHLRELLLVPGLKVVPNILRGDEGRFASPWASSCVQCGREQPEAVGPGSWHENRLKKTCRVCQQPGEVLAGELPGPLLDDLWGLRSCPDFLNLCCSSGCCDRAGEAGTLFGRLSPVRGFLLHSVHLMKSQSHFRPHPSRNP